MSKCSIKVLRAVIILAVYSPGYPRHPTLAENIDMCIRRQKDADGMANSVDPDQTAPRSSLIWVYSVCLELSVRILWIVAVH